VSHIRVEFRTATVTLDGAIETQTAAGRGTVTYSGDDLLEAVRAALLAAGDPRAGAVEELYR
jgi:hypothetical protein